MTDRANDAHPDGGERGPSSGCKTAGHVCGPHPSSPWVAAVMAVALVVSAAACSSSSSSSANIEGTYTGTVLNRSSGAQGQVARGRTR